MPTSASSEKLTTISKNPNIVTLINVATVEPENQQRLVELFVEATENVMCKQPGFISANFHKSLDGEKVVTYAQWKSVKDFRAVFTNPEIRSQLPDFSKFLKSEQVGVYEVCYTNNASSEL